MARRIGVVGYGVGGQIFHVPFIQATPEWELVGVVTRNPARREVLAAEAPGIPAFDSLSALIDAGVDAVTLTTPPETRRELALEAISRGVAVIADKPFAPDAAGARELVAAADEAGVFLTVFHNRRWDTDVRTLKALLDAGELGEPWRLSLRFDLDDPGTLETGPAHGLLRDLGSHVVDQAIHLLGPVDAVDARLDTTTVDGDEVDCGFIVNLRHRGGAYSSVSSSKINHLAEKEIVAYGSAGSYTVRGTDAQADLLFAGHRPATYAGVWGAESAEHEGVLHTAEGSRSVPALAGNYADFYRGVAHALETGVTPPVTTQQAVHTLEVLDAARASHLAGTSVAVAREE